MRLNALEIGLTATPFILKIWHGHLKVEDPKHSLHSTYTIIDTLDNKSRMKYVNLKDIKILSSSPTRDTLIKTSNQTQLNN